MEIIVRESVSDCNGSLVEHVPLAAGRQVSLRRDRYKYTYTRIEALLSVYGNTTEGKRRAAKELGIGLSSLYRIISNYKREKSWGRVE
jgi:transcriptional regulator with PAS, ATPase and Fis domain